MNLFFHAREIREIGKEIVIVKYIYEIYSSHEFLNIKRVLQEPWPKEKN